MSPNKNGADVLYKGTSRSRGGPQSGADPHLLEGSHFQGVAWEGCCLSFSLSPQNHLRMVATQPIPKGHEIFNTYGQMANWQLIHMYGFVEPYPDNTDDTADIQMVTVREAALQSECFLCALKSVWHTTVDAEGSLW